MALKAFTRASAFTSSRTIAPRRAASRKAILVRASSNDDVPSTSDVPSVTPVAAPVSAGFNFGDAMAFSGPLPETVNGRLAMLGFFSALGAELATGEPVSQQFADAPLPILGAFVAFAVASAIPLLKGADLKQPFGPFTPSAELVNGRAAMVGLVALLTVEFFKGVALF